MGGLLASDGPLDKLSAGIAIAFTATWYFAHGVGLPVAEDALRQIWYTVFGLLDAGGPVVFSSSNKHTAAVGAAYAFPVFGMCLPVFLGTENSVGRHYRQYYTFWAWLGWTLYHLDFLVRNQEAYARSPSNWFWFCNNAFMVYVHYLWVGGDIRHKLKLA